jgi:5'(3')-deoxyribonucleotidase
MTIGVDADGILFDYVGTAAEWLNRRVGRNVASVETATNFDVLRAWGYTHLQDEMDAYFRKPGVVYNMPVLEDAVAFIDNLNRLDDFVIITSCPASWHCEREKALMDRFKIQKARVNYSYDKGIYNVSALIDDYPGNFLRFKGRRILMDRPWNQNSPLYCCRVFDYNEALCRMHEES